MNEFWAAFGGGAAAGILSITAVGVAEWLRWYLDRPTLRMDLRVGTITRVEGPQLIQEGANPHSRPITLTGFGLSYKNKDWGSLFSVPRFDLGYRVPHKLECGEKYTHYSPARNTIEALFESKRVPEDLKWVFSQSAAGQTFRARIPDSTIRQLRKHWATDA